MSIPAQAANADPTKNAAEMTLLEFFNVYAPSSDSNQPNIYYARVAVHLLRSESHVTLSGPVFPAPSVK